jgi:hypothetical protein
MRFNSTCVCLFAAALLLMSGCAGHIAGVQWHDAGADSSYALPVDVASVLTAAGEDDGPGPDEVDTNPVQNTAPRSGGAGLGLLAHAGLFTASGADTVSFDTSLLFGVVLETSILRSDSLSIEIGADFTSVSNADEELTSTMTLLTASAKFAPGAGGFFVTGSGSILVESYSDDKNNTSGSNAAPLVGLGAGYSPPEGKWDVRAGYHLISGSDNLPALLTLTGGYSF